MTEQVRKIRIECTQGGTHDGKRVHLITLRTDFDPATIDVERLAAVALAGHGESIDLRRCGVCGNVERIGARRARLAIEEAVTQFSAGRLTAVVDITVIA